MSFKVKCLTEVEVKYLKVEARVRYWEDVILNEGSDDDGDRMPFREGDIWKPVIELETGTIIDWPEGVSADVHFKVADAGVYSLLNADKEAVAILDGYVPNIMCPEGDGYGDYIIMKIGPEGKIAKWKVSLAEFDPEVAD